MKFVRRLASIILTPLALLATQYAQADLVSSKDLPMALAMEAAAEAVAACEKSNYRVTVTVLDRAGQTRVILKGDNATPHTLDSSRGKAYTVVTLGPILKMYTSGDIATRIRENPAAAGLSAIPGLVFLTGGMAIKSGDEIIAGIGVGGAPGGNLDEVCAKAGIDKIKDRLEH
ncbi:MAG: heme-binding protein [Burkholderiales bacterium]